MYLRTTVLWDGPYHELKQVVSATHRAVRYSLIFPNSKVDPNSHEREKSHQDGAPALFLSSRNVDVVSPLSYYSA